MPSYPRSVASSKSSMGAVNDKQFELIFAQPYHSLKVSTDSFEKVIGVQCLDEVPSNVMDTVFSQLSLGLYCCHNVEHLGDSAVRGLMKLILNPIICAFGHDRKLKRGHLKHDEEFTVPTNDILRRAGIKKDGRADLVICKGPRCLVVFKIKKEGLARAHKQIAVYLHGLMMSQKSSKVFNSPHFSSHLTLLLIASLFFVRSLASVSPITVSSS